MGLQPNKKSAKYHEAFIQFVDIERQLEEALHCSPHPNPDYYFSELQKNCRELTNMMHKEGLKYVDPDRLLTHPNGEAAEQNFDVSDIESVCPVGSSWVAGINDP